MRLRTAYGIVLLVASCGQVEQTPDLSERLPQVSGTRLQAMAWVSEQGPTVYMSSLYDTQREEWCAFRETEDGSFRCFPTAVARYVKEPRGDCPHPIFDSNLNQEERTRRGWSLNYGMLDQTDRCGATSIHIYELGESVSPLSSCAVEGSPSEGLYAGGAPIPDHEFVRAQPVISREAGPLDVRYLEAEDGSSQWLEFYDRLHGDACAEASFINHESRCVPKSTLYQANWDSSDAFQLCSSVIVGGSDCERSRYGRAVNDIYRVLPAEAVFGTAFDSPTLRDCLSRTSEFISHPYAFTELITPELPKLVQSTIKRGSLEAPVKGAENSKLAAPFMDNRRLKKGEEYCEIRTAIDGKPHCLPWPRVAYFADSQCTQPLAIPEELSIRLASASEMSYRVYRAGEPFSGPFYLYTNLNWSTPNCELAGSSPLPEGDTLHWAVEVPPSEFVEYTQVVLR